jgi:hypothetical protein
MPPRRIIPGEGAKYQNVVAYKADLHLKHKVTLCLNIMHKGLVSHKGEKND